MKTAKPLTLPDNLAEHFDNRQMKIIEALAALGGESEINRIKFHAELHTLERKGLIELVRRTRTTGGGYRHIYRLKLAKVAELAG